MAKKQVRVSEEVLHTLQNTLNISDDAHASVDELIVLLLMKTQSSKKQAQYVLDRLGSNFLQRTVKNNKPRLHLDTGHFVENGDDLHIESLLNEVDKQVTVASNQEILAAITNLQNETQREHARQLKFMNIFTLSIRTMVADLLHLMAKDSDTPRKILGHMQLSDDVLQIRRGADYFAKEEVDKQQKKSGQSQRKGYYND